MKIMIKPLLRPALVLFALLTLLCGVFYPYMIAGIGQIVFPYQANGSLVLKNGHVVGSALIGQEFSSPHYFWGRQSATSPMPDNAASSGGSNLGPSNPALVDAIKGRIAALKAADPGNTNPIPVDLVTASASGLDPEISIAAANYQATRIARVRKLSVETILGLIARHSKFQYFKFLGEPRVNVLELNLALDRLN
ncbi:K+-transporting ATPase ATPase C chain [Paralcaligenes ureilyticus]|uniref:Potassium-transporting ATPase KdpC subunit n=1 Tax=Paralcaligenes ureilyticus TaxID=627131 RepID=A0A4R3ME25_9BURK|nr:K+-transporting ATPase ATPase C chain [Paralcaligenes ureilyticus]